MNDADVVVLGGGLAGLATAIELRKREHDVLVVEDGKARRPTLGESLEFSAPKFLAELGLEPADLIAKGVGYPKHNVLVSLSDANDFEIWPPGWFGRAPFYCSNKTLHIDRLALDGDLRKLAAELGVRFLDDRVALLDMAGRSIGAAVTQSNQRLRATWFVDATGQRSRLVGRTLGLERRIEGNRRVAYHARLRVDPWVHATSLRFSTNRGDDLTWSWAIPLSDQEVSFGVCIPEQVLHARQPLKGDSDAIFWEHLGSVDGLGGLDASDLDQHRSMAKVTSTTYTPFTHARVSGPNWVLVGDAAGLVDPVTSSGVATALRSATTTAELINSAGDSARRLRRSRAAHHHASSTVVSGANLITDRVLFRRGLRRMIGLRLAIFVFAAPVLVIHSWFAKLRPRRGLRMAAHRLLIATARAFAHAIGLLGARSTQ